MSEKLSGCGCCSECTGGPDCACGCPDCTCGDCGCCVDDCGCGESKFVLSAVSSIVGMLLLGVLAILLSISHLDAAWNSVSVIVTSDYGFLLFCVAAALAIAGIFALKAGDLTEGILFALVGLFFVITYGSDILGYGTLPYLGWIIVFVLFMVMLILFVGRDLTFGLGVLFFFIGFVFALAFDDGDIGPIIAGASFLIAGLILLYVAISDWIFVETGVDLPLL